MSLKKKNKILALWLSSEIGYAGLWLSITAVILQFIIFKYFYPFASYIHGDSFVYLETAYKNLSINTYMIGYSMFLRLFSVFTTSDYALTFFQYLFLHVSAQFLLLTTFYFYKPIKFIKITLFFFLILNPLFLFMGNLVSSDAIFLGSSFIWFSLLIWIMHTPNRKLIFWHAIIIFICFTLRYNGLLYFFISLIAIALSSQNLKKKLISVSIAGIGILGFVAFTANKFKLLTGSWQYSPFAGWQLTNNGMYAYRFVEKSERIPVPKRFQAVDHMIREYFDSTRDHKKHPEEELLASTVYMWDPGSPLYKYRNQLFKNDSTASELKKWASMGPLYKDYGVYLISHYPIYFAKYFLWPNANKYYAPPVEFLSMYNSNHNNVMPIAQMWFNYKSEKVYTRTKTLQIKMLDFYPILSGTINVVMFFGLISYLLLGGWRQNLVLQKGIILGGSFWALNAGFTIFASSAALRFQSFPILMTIFYVGVLISWLWKMTKNPIAQIVKNETYSLQG